MRQSLLIIALLLSTLMSAQVVTKVVLEKVDSKSDITLDKSTINYEGTLRLSMDFEIGGTGIVVIPIPGGDREIRNFIVLDISRKDDLIYISTKDISEGISVPTYISFLYGKALKLVMLCEIDDFKGITYYSAFHMQ